MKPRKKRVSPRRDIATVTFVNVETPELLVHRDATTPPPETVRGKFVKMAPQIAAEARDAFDSAAAMQEIRDAGALGVILAPSFVRAARPKMKDTTRTIDPRRLVSAWFGEQRGAAPEERAAARDLVLAFMDEEGM